MSMKMLDYNFGKKGDDAGVAGPSPGPKSPRRNCSWPCSTCKISLIITF